MTYNPSIPVGTTNLDVDYANIQTNFSQLNTLFSIDHVPLTDATANKGFHTVIHLLNQTGNPGNNLAAGQLYAKPGNVGSDKQLFFKTPGGGVEQISGNQALANGYGWFSGMLMQWGIVTSAFSSISGTVTFATNNVEFPTNCFNVQLTLIGDSSSGQTLMVDSSVANNPDKTRFVWKFTVNPNTTSYTGFYWVAIGN